MKDRKILVAVMQVNTGRLMNGTALKDQRTNTLIVLAEASLLLLMKTQQIFSDCLIL